MQVSRKLQGDFDRDFGHAGLLVPQVVGLGAVASSALVANATYAVRFVPSRNMTIASIAFAVTTAAGTGDSNIDLGIYDGTGTTVLGSTGAEARGINTAGRKVGTLDTPVDVKAGVTYYAGLATAAAFAGTAPNVQAITPGGSLGAGAQMFGTSIGVLDFLRHAGGVTLQTPLAATNSLLAPVLALLEA